MLLRGAGRFVGGNVLGSLFWAVASHQRLLDAADGECVILGVECLFAR